jgi:hypothetical protein
MNGTRIDISLEKYQIGLTGAIPGRENWSEPAMDYAILEFVALFSGIVFKYGGRIVHGCQPAFMPIILRQARLHSDPNREKRPITFVMSNLWAKSLPMDFHESIADVAEFATTRQIGTGTADDPETRNQSLTEMRQLLISSQNIMVAVGGKMHKKDGMVPGVLEELDLAAQKLIPRFLVAGMGGYAAQYAEELAPVSLYNGLTDDQNRLLFSTSDVGACVSIIFEQLAKQQLD